ncbi:hypothetical protein POM88_052374 [Heracleum sosnowskyi]|uniref:Methylenetetrahydrofolate reductase n=1 Tax=Heracleum sosnowskyi TaxID=360622 RepID=A0AAD8LYU4_9APIA|nr:hypothetical protein POM88_052374 [Heracleum sosnowskyi]
MFEAHPDVIQSSGEATLESYENDLACLKKKVDAGADVIVTQLFYDTYIFLNYELEEGEDDDNGGGEGKLILFQVCEHLTLEDVLNATGQVMEKTSYGTVYKAKLADGGTIVLSTDVDAMSKLNSSSKKKNGSRTLDYAYNGNSWKKRDQETGLLCTDLWKLEVKKIEMSVLINYQRHGASGLHLWPLDKLMIAKEDYVKGKTQESKKWRVIGKFIMIKDYKVDSEEEEEDSNGLQGVAEGVEYINDDDGDGDDDEDHEDCDGSEQGDSDDEEDSNVCEEEDTAAHLRPTNHLKQKHGVYASAQIYCDEITSEKCQKNLLQRGHVLHVSCHNAEMSCPSEEDSLRSVSISANL